MNFLIDEKKTPFFLCFSGKKNRGSGCNYTMDTATGTLSLCQWPIFSSSPPSLRMHVRVSCGIPHLSASAVDKTLSQINNSGIIACLRANSAEVALKAANAAIAGGVSVLEIVVSTPGSAATCEGASYNGPWGMLSSLKFLSSFSEGINVLCLGVRHVNLPRVKESGEHAIVGTVLKIEDAKNAINAGAKFLLSPATVKDIMVMDYVQSGEVLYIPGTMTPTEILSAWDAGAKIVKIYPVSALGGFQYISALKKTFPHVSMVASQGITIDAIGEYILRGASSVVLSDAIFDKEAIEQLNFDKIHKLARSATLLGNKAVNR